MKCTQCRKNTTNPKFCSRSCSVKFNNSKKPKRTKTRVCKLCPSLIASDRTYCPACYKEWLGQKKAKRVTDEYTIEQCQLKKSVHGKYLAAKNNHVRNHCQVKHAALRKMPCSKCGYAKHVELCHIIPIREFPLETTLGVVNHANNVIQLCRNCHWEMDHPNDS